jgi:chromodomain-helicase-DNA-binding protein 7
MIEFGQCETEKQVGALQDILKPMMLRRLKEDVEKNLKPKEETIVEVELTNIQKKYYRAILEKNFTYLAKGVSVPSLMNTMMELRKCCNHPFLVNGAEDQILYEMKSSVNRNLLLDDQYALVIRRTRNTQTHISGAYSIIR